MLTPAVKRTLRNALIGGLTAAGPLLVHDLNAGTEGVDNWWHLAAVFAGAVFTVVAKALTDTDGEPQAG